MSTTCCAPGYMPPKNVLLDEGVRLLYDMSKDQLVDIIVDSAKNWLAHDGLWFQAIEATHGMDAAMDADREACRAAGMDAFLAKPFDRAELEACIARIPGGDPAAPAA